LNFCTPARVGLPLSCARSRSASSVLWEVQVIDDELGVQASGPGDYLASSDCVIVPAERNVPAYGYPGFAREIDLSVLAEALHAAAMNVERTSSLGRVGRERVLQDWSWTDKCHSYLRS
jgi:hypothetical protein